MARKNLLGALTEAKLTAVNPDPAPTRLPAPGFVGRGALGAVTRSIDDLAARAESARQLEARLASGQVVVELDPASIDPSFIRDRMADDEDAHQTLLRAVREQGQISPVLVRPHPAVPGRYQVAFGHRRLRVARELGQPIRAVIRPLSDRDLVVAQGQENSARTDLSFIERASFAHRLEQAGYDRPTIMAALAVDKTTVSRLISVASGIPAEVIAAIGPAPGVGRDRWLQLLAEFSRGTEPPDGLLDGQDFARAGSDARFGAVLDGLRRPAAATRATAPDTRRTWSSRDGHPLLTLSRAGRRLTLWLHDGAMEGFPEFLASHMDDLLREYDEGRKRGG